MIVKYYVRVKGNALRLFLLALWVAADNTEYRSGNTPSDELTTSSVVVVHSIWTLASGLMVRL